MKAEQSSLYRQLELLHLWCLDTFDNAPKGVMISRDIEKIVDAVTDAASTVAIALNTEEAGQRMDMLDIVVLRLTEFKFLTRGLTEFSSNMTRGKHVISKSQRVRMLDIMTQIGNELGRWCSATMKKRRRAAGLSE